MRLTYENEAEARTIAFATALGGLVVLCMVLFLVSITSITPNPPPVEYVEVNFGTTDRGSGTVQTDNKPNPSPRAEAVKRSDDRPVSKVKVIPRVERVSEPTPVQPDRVKPTRVVAEKPLITSRAESPVSEVARPVPKRESALPARPTIAPPRAEPARKVESVDQSALYKRSSAGGGSNGTTGRAEGIGGNSNGDDRAGTGDKGNPDGAINAKEFYGKPGGSKSGVALNVSGWAFGSNKLDKDDSDEGGKITYQIRVDSDGTIVSARPIQQTVSPSVESFYRRQVMRFKLRPKGSVTPSDLSTGTLTITISAN